MSFSLLLAACLAWAIDYSSYARRLEQAPNEPLKLAVLRELYASPEIDEMLAESLRELVEGASFSITVDQAERMVRLRAFAQRATSGKPATEAAKHAKEVKSNPLYQDPGDKEQSNWFSKGFESLGSLVSRWLEALFRRNAPDIGMDEGRAVSLEWLKLIFWIVLTAAVGALIYFAARHFSWKQKLQKKTTALLAEDEPELSRDEYLENADKLISEGRFREAVRYLYLACLILFDEHGVARFVRGQTNWEHLMRIQASEKRPDDLDFVPATRRFDTVWYGMHVEGLSDVEFMRDVYEQIAAAVRRKAA